MGSVISRVDRCGKDLAWWNKNVFGSVKRELEKKKKALLEAEREALQSGLNFRVRELQRRLTFCLTGRLGCGTNKLVFYGSAMEIITSNISTRRPHTDSGKIQL